MMEPKQEEANGGAGAGAGPGRWEGKVSTRLGKAKADQIWALYLDFFNFHKWFPTLTACYGAHGANGEPRCIRYCQGSSIPTAGPHAHPFTWSEERLLSVDPAARRLTYEIVDSNIGFESYVSTVRVAPAEEEEESGGGCVIEWSFGVRPVDGLALEDLVTRYQVGLQRTAQNMEDALYGPARTD